MAAGSAARLLEDAAMARREAPAYREVRGHQTKWKRPSARHSLMIEGPREDGRTRRLHKEYGRRSVGSYPSPERGGSGALSAFTRVFDALWRRGWGHIRN